MLNFAQGRLQAFCSQKPKFCERPKIILNILIQAYQKHSWTLNLLCNNIESCSHMSLREFNKARCKLLCVGQSQTWLSDQPTESSPVGKDPAGLGDEKLNVSLQGVLTAQKDNCTLGCINRRMSSKLREGILPLPSSETLPGILCSSWSSQYKKDMALLKCIQKRPRGAGTLPLGTGWKNWGCSYGREKAKQGDLVVAFQYFRVAYRKDGKEPLIRECSDRTRDNGFKLREDNFILDIRKKIHILRFVWH